MIIRFVSLLQISPNNIRELHLQRIAAGRASFAFNNPAVSIFIMKSNPAHLQRFIRNFQDILKGDDVSLKSLGEVKTTDFKVQPKKLCVLKKEELKGIAYPSSLETLELISLGGLPEDVLPWDLRMIADKLSVKCSKCRQWTASPMISSCFIYERIDFAMETDRLHMVTMHCLACQKCVVRVGQEIVRNLL
ncbi:hypothetical protein TELCIR_08777 [Teladorsagia circumcincta]|uniref:PIF1/LRR1 pleckstrin homology domain-containing protein n=1 Tax=Teladorsagia circumcincta TaxID=45464 RepID=A0A2G9UGP6_TELCI|nr:hypothetical protein TELCIR_08777 [Teladorsagia circumcincta]